MVPKSQLGPVLGNLNYQWCVCNQRFGILKAWKSKSEGRGFESRFWLPFSFAIFPLKIGILPDSGPVSDHHLLATERAVVMLQLSASRLSRFPGSWLSWVAGPPPEDDPLLSRNSNPLPVTASTGTWSKSCSRKIRFRSSREKCETFLAGQSGPEWIALTAI